MGKFSTEERDKLYGLFTIDEHEIREGATSKDKKKISWFTYVRREAIIMRLDTLFFGEWESGFINHASPYQYHQTHVDCAMYITIRGMRREYNGSQDGGGLNGAKGAATDAFKRVASQWGIGLYLQQSPQIWTENYKDESGKPDWKKKDKVEAEAMSKVAAWLKQLGATGNAMKSDSDNSDDEPQAPQQPTQRPQPQVQPKPQAQPTATDESSWDENTWKRHAFTVSKFLYTDLDGKYVEQRHSASMKKRMEDTGDYGINPSMTLYEVLSKLIRYRALTDLFIDSGDYGNIFGMSFEDFYDKNGAEATWTRFMDYYIANTQPAKTKAS
jgi:hypothetical protein